MAQRGNEKVCRTGRKGSFNKHNDVMGSSFFTALSFLFIQTAELLCGAETVSTLTVYMQHTLCKENSKSFNLSERCCSTVETPKSDKERHAYTPTCVSNMLHLQHDAAHKQLWLLSSVLLFVKNISGFLWQK